MNLEVILMSTHNICFYGKLTKIIFQLSSNTIRICSTELIHYLGDNCIQNFYLGQYIVGYMVGNFVLPRHVSRAVKGNFRPYNRRYTSPNENFEYGYPNSNALFNIYPSKAQYFAPNVSFDSNEKPIRQPITSNVTYDVDAATVYRIRIRIYRRKFLMLSSQTSRYILKCIRIKG